MNRAYDCLRSFADHAWRRPAKQEELIRLLHFVEAAQKSDAGWQQGLASAFKAILVSPFFLFRFELDDGAAGAGRSRSLNDFELAARLSYFLWSSMPDEELKHLAARNNLHKANILSAQVARMLRRQQSRCPLGRIRTSVATDPGLAGMRIPIRNDSRVLMRHCGRP